MLILLVCFVKTHGLWYGEMQTGQWSWISVCGGTQELAFSLGACGTPLMTKPTIILVVTVLLPAR